MRFTTCTAFLAILNGIVSVLSDTVSETPASPQEASLTLLEVTSSKAVLEWNPDPPKGGYYYQLCIADSTLKDSQRCKDRYKGKKKTIRFRGLKPWTNYELRTALKKDDLKYLKNVSTYFFQTAPEAPEGKVKVVSANTVNGTFHLKWTEPPKTNGPLSGYMVSFCVRNMICAFGDDIHVQDKCYPNPVNTTEVSVPVTDVIAADIIVVPFNIDLQGLLIPGDKTYIGCFDFNVPNGLVAAVYARGSTWIQVEWYLEETFPVERVSVDVCHADKSGGRQCALKTLPETITGLNITGLAAYTRYDIKLRGHYTLKSDDVVSTNTIQLVVTTAVDAPKGSIKALSVANVSGGIVVFWSQPNTPNGPLDGYKVQWCERKNSTCLSDYVPTPDSCVEEVTPFAQSLYQSTAYLETSVDLIVTAFNLNEFTDLAFGQDNNLGCFIIPPQPTPTESTLTTSNSTDVETTTVTSSNATAATNGTTSMPLLTNATTSST